LKNIGKNSLPEDPTAGISYVRDSNSKECGVEKGDMTHNPLLAFVDNLDTSAHRHIVMFYEEPEYAKTIQIRFLNDGLRRGECCVYAARDYDDLRIIKAGMIESGIDVDYNMKKALLQFYMRKPTVIDSESYKQARSAFQGEIERAFKMQDGNDSTVICPKIRGVGSISRDVFSMKEGESSNRSEAAASQVMVERLFQQESTASFDGIWMCAYQVDDIFAAIDKEWMAELLATHDAVIYLPKLSNGIGLDIRK
jgi:DcmR-like sensory protein